MEDGLRQFGGWTVKSQRQFVLILVFVEDGLRHLILCLCSFSAQGLNPCFCGRWSATNSINCVVSPGIYIAIGISGAVHHTCAIEGADTVIAINPDRDSRIFEYADYGILESFQ